MISTFIEEAPPTTLSVTEMETEMLAASLPVLLAMIGAVLLGWAVAAVFRKQYGGTIQPWLAVLPMLASALLLWRYGFGPELLQGMVLCLALLYASAADIRTREVPDCVPVTITVAGLIGRTPEEIPLMILAAVAVTIPQLAAAILKPGSYGGADIKIMAAGAFLLGLSRGLAAIMAGLLLAVVCTALVRKIRKQTMKASFALAPYLSAGILLAYFI